MSSVLPPTKAELLSFCEAHLPVWTTSASLIGLTSGDLDEFAELITAAGETSHAAVGARNAAKAATMADNSAFAALRTDAAALVAKIKFKAESTSDPEVYINAQIPAPLPPSPAPAPTRPTLLKASIEPGGGLTINWKAANPGTTGVVYQVYRKLPMQTSFTLVGFSGGRDKYFTDLTLPAGNSGVQYVIQGARGGISGAQSEILTVNFGIEGGPPGGGFAFSTMSHAEPVRIAA